MKNKDKMLNAKTKNNTFFIKEDIFELFKDFKIELKKEKEEKKLKKKEIEKKKILFDKQNQIDKSLFNLKTIKIKEEHVSTHIDDWDEMFIESPLINKQSILCICPLIKKEFTEIKHIVYSNNYLIRLFTNDNIWNIHKDNISLHIEEGKLKFLNFVDSDIILTTKIITFIKDYLNETITEIEYEKSGKFIKIQN